MDDMISKNIAELVMNDNEYAYDLQEYLNAKISTKKHVNKDYDSYLKRYNLVSSYLFLNERIDNLEENTLFDENAYILKVSEYGNKEINMLLIKLYQEILVDNLIEEDKIINCFQIRAINSYLKLLKVLDS